jgi:hypothetical protein
MSKIHWISVEDRLPEDASKRYLVSSSWGVTIAYKHGPEWANGCFQDVATSSDEGMYDYDKCKGAFVVYHWADLPEAV